MSWRAVLVLSLLFLMTFISLQRADPSRKKVIRNFSIFMYLLIGFYAWWYRAYIEMLVGLAAAALISGLFWLLIGRYNPVNSSDDIRVLGMDD